VPSPTFADLGVSDAVSRALSERGIDHPFPVQRKIVPDVLAGHDVLVRSPTGSGKTLAFGVPLVENIEATDPRPSALILAPTRELAAQIEDELYPAAHSRALKIAVAYGGVGIVKQARLAAKAHILVACPGRLLDLVQRGDVSLKNVRLLVLDEADRMLDMGFKPTVDRIVKMTREDRQTILCSATLEGEVDRIAKSYTRDARRHEVDAAEREKRGHIDHQFVRIAHESKVERLITELRDRERGLTLVFVRTKRGADRLVKKLRAQGVESVAMHGDKTQGQRERALASFEQGKVDTLIATDVAARGIDVAGITHVINFDAPPAREDYVHRAGRTGRAGASGTAITFVLDDQVKDTAKFASEIGLDKELQHGGLSHGAGHGVSHGAKPAGPRPGAGAGGGAHAKGRNRRGGSRNRNARSPR
jgi:ATP-dependent RNA helicase RhlE